jgi:hypothetical protein
VHPPPFSPGRLPPCGLHRLGTLFCCCLSCARCSRTPAAAAAACCWWSWPCTPLHSSCCCRASGLLFAGHARRAARRAPPSRRARVQRGKGVILLVRVVLGAEAMCTHRKHTRTQRHRVREPSLLCWQVTLNALSGGVHCSAVPIIIEGVQQCSDPHSHVRVCIDGVHLPARFYCITRRPLQCSPAHHRAHTNHITRGVGLVNGPGESAGPHAPARRTPAEARCSETVGTALPLCCSSRSSSGMTPASATWHTMCGSEL